MEEENWPATWQRVHEHLEIMRAPNGQARLNRWQERDTEKVRDPMIEITTGLDELSTGMARLLVKDLEWLIRQTT